MAKTSLALEIIFHRRELPRHVAVGHFAVKSFFERPNTAKRAISMDHSGSISHPGGQGASAMKSFGPVNLEAR